MMPLAGKRPKSWDNEVLGARDQFPRWPWGVGIGAGTACLECLGERHPHLRRSVLTVAQWT